MYDFEISDFILENLENKIIFTSDDEEEEGKNSAKLFEDKLGAKLIELNNKGHFTEEDMGTKEFPELLQEILN